MEDVKNNEIINTEILDIHKEYLDSRKKLIERKRETVEKVISNKDYAYKIDGINYNYSQKSGIILTVRANDSDISHSFRNNPASNVDKRDIIVTEMLGGVEEFIEGLMKDFKEIEWLNREYTMCKNNLYSYIVYELRNWTNSSFDIAYLFPLVISIGETKYIVIGNDKRRDPYNPSPPDNRTEIELRPYIEYSLQ